MMPQSLRTLRNLGGHDLGDLLDAFAAADGVVDRPSVIFAYTIKAWRLPTEGHPGNHSALLSDEQWRATGGSTWTPTPTIHGPVSRLAARRPALRNGGRTARREPVTSNQAPAVSRPRSSAATTPGIVSTQQAFGRFFARPARVRRLRWPRAS